MLACPKPSPGLAAAPCDMSKCCPSSGPASRAPSAMFPALTTAPTQALANILQKMKIMQNNFIKLLNFDPFYQVRRPSSVSISDGLICGVNGAPGGSLATNQRPGSRSRDHSGPMVGPGGSVARRSAPDIGAIARSESVTVRELKEEIVEYRKNKRFDQKIAEKIRR